MLSTGCCHRLCRFARPLAFSYVLSTNSRCILPDSCSLCRLLGVIWCKYQKVEGRYLPGYSYGSDIYTSINVACFGIASANLTVKQCAYAYQWWIQRTCASPWPRVRVGALEHEYLAHALLQRKRIVPLPFAVLDPSPLKPLTSWNYCKIS